MTEIFVSPVLALSSHRNMSVGIQIEVLEAFYVEEQYPERHERVMLAQLLGVEANRVESSVMCGIYI